IKQGTDIVGNKTRIKIVKNKVAPPFKQAIIDIMYGEGISLEGEILDMGSELEVIEKSGAWYSYQGERLGQGRENAKQFLLENEKETDYKKIRDYYKLDQTHEDIIKEEEEAAAAEANEAEVAKKEATEDKTAKTEEAKK